MDTFTVSQDYQGLDPSVNYFIFTNTISPNQDNSVLFKEFRGPRHSFRTKGVVSKETVVLHQWNSITKALTKGGRSKRQPKLFTEANLRFQPT